MGEKIQISKEQWERRLQDVRVTKEDLNRLVMDYLTVEGFQAAAEEFSKEANLPRPANLESIETRMSIRDAVDKGDIEEAIAQVNDMDPDLLESNKQLHFHLQQQRLIEYIREGKISEALEFAQTELAPRGEEDPAFLLELEKTMTLFAFDADPNPPEAVAGLLHPSHRHKAATELNAAILRSLGQNTEPRLMSLLKLMCWGEDLLSEKTSFPRVEFGPAANDATS